MNKQTKDVKILITRNLLSLQKTATKCIAKSERYSKYAPDSDDSPKLGPQQIYISHTSNERH